MQSLQKKNSYVISHFAIANNYVIIVIFKMSIENLSLSIKAANTEEIAVKSSVGKKCMTLRKGLAGAYTKIFLQNNLVIFAIKSIKLFYIIELINYYSSNRIDLIAFLQNP